MAWQKSTSNYVPSWRFLSVDFNSLVKTSIFSLFIGMALGFIAVKAWGLPGDKARTEKKWFAEKKSEGEKLKDRVCKEFPNSKVCNKN